MEQDFEFACVHGPSEPNVDAGRPVEAISWRCDVCGYHMLAMDHRGNALPLERGPRGELLPVFCSRCNEEHADWTPTTPFGTLGDHANIKAAFSDKVNAGVPMADERKIRALVMEHVPTIGQLQTKYTAEEETGKPQASSPADSYACGRCGRRLQRMDANGNLVPLDRDARGNTVPLECPGCRELHSEWVQTSLHVKLKPAARVTVPDFAAGISKTERDILQRPLRRSSF
jgi:DNA-directed RNA polymerase subunit RPC12/RpoP